MNAKDEAKIFGKWLTERMAEGGLQVPDIVREVGVDTRVVRGWRNGRSTPRGENMWRLFSALGYPVPAGLPRSTSAELADINAKLDGLVRTVRDNGKTLARTDASFASIRGLVTKDDGEGNRELGQ